MIIIDPKLREELRESGVRHSELNDNNRVILSIDKDENYLENPKVMDYLSKGYVIEKKINLLSCQLVLRKQE